MGTVLQERQLVRIEWGLFWQEPYVEIADSLDIGTSLNILSNNDYYHYGWLGRKNGVAEILQIQSLRSNGTKLFIGGSIQLSPSPTSITLVPIISSLEGSNIYAWTQWDNPQTYNANYARRIDTTGTDNWFKSPVFDHIVADAGGAADAGLHPARRRHCESATGDRRIRYYCAPTPIHLYTA